MLKVTNNAIRMTRGDTGIFAIAIKQPDGTEYDLQPGDLLEFTVRKKPESKVLIHKTGKNIRLDPEDTAELAFGEYVYDVQLTTGSVVDTIIPPTSFEIMQEVTY